MKKFIVNYCLFAPTGAANRRSQQAWHLLLVCVLFNCITLNTMAQEMTSTCGTDLLMPSAHTQVTLPENAKTNIVHPCGSTGTVNLRVVVHFMLKSDGTGNFNEYNDGRVADPIPAGESSDYHYRWNGYRFAAHLVHAANSVMTSNGVLKETPHASCFILPSTLPAVFPIRILYTLQGVYFHRSNTSYNEYWTSATFNYDNTYAVKKDSCIQVYLFPNAATPSASGYVWQIPADDNKMAVYLKNLWLGYNVSTGVHWENVIWSQQIALHKSLNHEIMHILGLYHTNDLAASYRDFCQDTPNCNNKSEYNTIVNDGTCNFCKEVLTPCQLDRVFTTLGGGELWNSGIAGEEQYKPMSYATKYRYQCNSCSPVGSPPFSFFHLNKNGCGEVFMGGGWYGTWFTFANQFIEIYETNAIGSSTVLGNYYSGWRAADEYSYLRNLSSFYTFQNNKIYRIKMAVQTSCVGWHESVQYLVYTNPNPCERVASNDINTPVSQVYPNPVVDKANLTFVHPAQHIQVVDATGRVVDTFVAETPHFTVWQPDINLPNGLYFVVSDNRQNSRIKVIVQR